MTPEEVFDSGVVYEVRVGGKEGQGADRGEPFQASGELKPHRHTTGLVCAGGKGRHYGHRIEVAGENETFLVQLPLGAGHLDQKVRSRHTFPLHPGAERDFRSLLGQLDQLLPVLSANIVPGCVHGHAEQFCFGLLPLGMLRLKEEHGLRPEHEGFQVVVGRVEVEKDDAAINAGPVIARIVSLTGIDQLATQTFWPRGRGARQVRPECVDRHRLLEARRGEAPATINWYHLRERLAPDRVPQFLKPLTDVGRRLRDARIAEDARSQPGEVLNVPPHLRGVDPRGKPFIVDAELGRRRRRLFFGNFVLFCPEERKCGEEQAQHRLSEEARSAAQCHCPARIAEAHHFQNQVAGIW